VNWEREAGSFYCCRKPPTNKNGMQGSRQAFCTSSRKIARSRSSKSRAANARSTSDSSNAVLKPWWETGRSGDHRPGLRQGGPSPCQCVSGNRVLHSRLPPLRTKISSRCSIGTLLGTGDYRGISEDRSPRPCITCQAFLLSTTDLFNPLKTGGKAVLTLSME
jgi:hypothetical protein